MYFGSATCTKSDAGTANSTEYYYLRGMYTIKKEKKNMHEGLLNQKFQNCKNVVFGARKWCHNLPTDGTAVFNDDDLKLTRIKLCYPSEQNCTVFKAVFVERIARCCLKVIEILPHLYIACLKSTASTTCHFLPFLNSFLRSEELIFIKSIL